MSRVFKFEVENFKRIRSFAMEIKKRITELTGKNMAGKSSAIDALWVLLKGLSVAPATPIREGAELARIRGQFGELIIERVFRRKGEKEFTSSLTVSNPDGAKYPSPQKKLDDLIGTHILDPLQFMEMESKKQFDVLRPFAPDVDFDAIDRAHKGDFDRRAEINKLASDARGAAAMITIPEGTPDETVDEAELLSELENASTFNSDIERRQRARADIAEAVSKARLDSGKKLHEAEELRQKATKLALEAHELDAQADAQQSRLDQAEVLPAKLDPSDIRAKIDEAKRINAQFNRRVQKIKHENTAIQYEQESKDMTDRINARLNAKRAAIADAKMPIPGLGFGEGVVILKGLPFDQASKGEQLRTATAISFALNPDAELPLVWIRDASLLDDDSFAIVYETAELYNGYVIAETVRQIGSDAIVIEDGMIKQVESAAA